MTCSVTTKVRRTRRVEEGQEEIRKHCSGGIQQLRGRGGLVRSTPLLLWVPALYSEVVETGNVSSS